MMQIPSWTPSVSLTSPWSPTHTDRESDLELLAQEDTRHFESTASRATPLPGSCQMNVEHQLAPQRVSRFFHRRRSCRDLYLTF